MAIEPIYEVVALSCNKRLCTVQIAVEANAQVHSSSIKRILGVTATVSAEPTEVFSQEARVSGRVNFGVLYITEAGETLSLERSADFSDKINDAAIEAGKPYLAIKVVEAKATEFSAEEIKLLAVLELTLFDSRAQRTKYLASGGENLYTNEQTIEYTSLVSAFGDEFIAETEEDFDCDELLGYETATVIKNFDSQVDMVRAGGEFVLRALGRKNGEIFQKEIVCPYLNECRADGTRNGNLVDASVCVSSVETALEEGRLKVCFRARAHGFVFAKGQASCVTDAFSVACELKKECQSVKYAASKGVFSFADEIDGSITLGDEMPIADKIVAVTGTTVQIASAYALEGRVVVDGVFGANLIYFSSESNTLSSVVAEIPFSLTKSASVCERDEVVASASVARIKPKVRRGNELAIRAEISVLVSVCEGRSVEIITMVTEGEEISVPTSAISLHIARQNESLWEIAKALCTTPELVLVQNPHLELPLRGGERIVAYRHLKK